MAIEHVLEMDSNLSSWKWLRKSKPLNTKTCPELFVSAEFFQW